MFSHCKLDTLISQGDTEYAIQPKVVNLFELLIFDFRLVLSRSSTPCQLLYVPRPRICMFHYLMHDHLIPVRQEITQ